VYPVLPRTRRRHGGATLFVELRILQPENETPWRTAAEPDDWHCPDDWRCMGLALEEARSALELDEVPVGAVIVREGRVLASAHNLVRSACDPTAHAEILAIRAAALHTRDLRLTGATAYTTVEPCFMCAGALLHARVERVVWAVRDPKFGAGASLARVLEDSRLNHRARVAEGERAEEARELMQAFFRSKREAARGD